VPYLREFGSYLPSRVVTNEEMGRLVGCTPEWIVDVAGIEQRRFAAEDESVADLAVRAAEDCLSRSGVAASSVGMIFVSSGSSPRRFPGPAAAVANRLGLEQTPAIDIPIASAGSLFGVSLASRLTDTVGNILVVAAEKMSSVALQPPMERGVAILFGDGAGACLVSPDTGKARIVGSELCSDGSFADDLRLEFGQPLSMNGRSVILQASRKVPRVISTVLERHGVTAADIDIFIMHQANRNLIARIAQSLGTAEDRFYSNIRRYGNTSSASMLIAAREWSDSVGFRPGCHVCFAVFGAGFHWGALLAVGL
jgi:3-oxoacyl-[acyl-carrier-protein] synthase III